MTPDNGGYATAAYALTAIVYLGYILSIKLRERRLRLRLQELEAARGRAASDPLSFPRP
jgi:hypothetical protein